MSHWAKTDCYSNRKMENGVHTTKFNTIKFNQVLCHNHWMLTSEE